MPTPTRRASALLRDLRRGHRDANLAEAAAASAFWVLIGFGPAGLVAINVLGLVVDQEQIAAHLSSLAEAAPGSFGDLLTAQFAAVASSSPGSLALDLVMVVLALWTISTAVVLLIRALRRTYGLADVGVVPLRAAAAVGACGAIVVIGVVAFVVDAPSMVRSGLAVLVASVVVFVLVLLLYRLSLGRAATLRGCAPGAALATLVLVAVQLLWEGVSSLSPNMAAMYGAVAGLVTSMLAVWLAAYGVLLGALLNAAVARTARPERDSVAAAS